MKPAHLLRDRRLRSSACLPWLAMLLALGAIGAKSPAETTRAPRVAGSFYPDDRTELLGVVTSLLERQPEPVITEKPRILIVPHAGYPYSGPIAASGFRQVQGHAYDGVVVVGFTHRLTFPGSSVDTREAYVTPLGELPVDQAAIAVLQAYPGIGHVEEAHAIDEHSLEVQLPFLQAALERVRLVPVLMGGAGLEDARRLADALAALSRAGDYLFIFTTDLSHYHPYDQAKAIDQTTSDAFLNETPQAVSRLFAAGEVEACGRGPIVTSLLLAAKLGHLKRRLLQCANSGDTAGDLSRVVGYAAIAMYDRGPPMSGRLSSDAGAALVRAARQTLENSLLMRPSSAPVRLDAYPELAQASGLFVTLRKRGELRGCIGRIQTDQPLATALPAVTMDAAQRDPRFSPLRPDEVEGLDVEVSVLTPPVRLGSLDELVPGRDGVILEYEGRSGVFLPQVWEETGWTRVEFLRELASQKAGLPPDAWQRATLSIFQDQVFSE